LATGTLNRCNISTRMLSERKKVNIEKKLYTTRATLVVIERPPKKKEPHITKSRIIASLEL
jgi:hypothetical protein